MKSAYLKVWLLLACFLISAASWAQTKKISGKVLDDESKPMAGVTISVKGKKGGTQTNANGEYNIDAAEGDVLVFSFTGFANQELVVGSTSTIDLALKVSAAKMDEVVVVGYGRQSRRTLSGSVSSLDVNALKSAPKSNVATALQGTVSGLRVQQSTGEPGTTPRIVFRGGADYNGTGEPLVILDGIIVQSLYGINMDDVESIDLLKDAASTSIYGARASNGVILVTTKKGKKGKAQVSYSFRQTTNYIRRNPMEYLSTADYIRWNRLGLQSSVEGYLADGNTTTANNRRNVLTTGATTGWAYPSGNSSPIAINSTQLVSNVNRHLIGAPMWNLLIDPNPFVAGQMDSILYRSTSVEQLEDAIMKQANSTEHNVNVSGANDQGAFALGLGVVDDKGIVVGGQLKRMNMNFNGGLNIGRKLKVTMNTSAYFIKQKLPYIEATNSTNSGDLGVRGLGSAPAGGYFQRLVGIGPTVRWTHDITGEQLPGNADGTFTLSNPNYIRDLVNINNTEQQRISGSLNLEYSILPSLKFLASGSGFLLFTNQNVFNKSYQVGSGGSFNTDRKAFFRNRNEVQYSYNAFLQYDKNFSNHKVSVLGGAEFYEYTSNFFNGDAQGAPSDFIPWLTAATSPSILNNAILNPQSASSNFDRWDRLASIIGRANYSYRDKYFVTANLRYDGTSRLNNNRYGLFPGVSLGWNMQNEDFFRNSSLTRYINIVKPRISWGQNGSISPLGYFAALQTYSSGVGNYNGGSGVFTSTLVNPDLMWERSSTLNIGADIALLNNRITIIGDYFVRNIYDKIGSISISPQTGFTSYPTNLGQLQNKGFELELRAKVLKSSKRDGLNIDLGFNITKVRTFSKELPFSGRPGNQQGGFLVWDPKNPGQQKYVGGLEEGKRAGIDEVWAISYNGIYTSAAEITADANVVNTFLPYTSLNGKKIKLLGDARWHQVYKNDTIDDRQRVFVGRTTPDLTGGFSTLFNYKGFSLHGQFDYALNFVILNNEKARGLSQAQGSQNSSTDVLNTWSPGKTSGTLPRFYYANDGRNYGTAANGSNGPAELWEKGDYLMLRELTLSYEVAQNILSKFTKNKIKSLRVYLTGSNLAYITEYTGTFPEFGGIDSGKYPLPRRLTFGLNLNL